MRIKKFDKYISFFIIIVLMISNLALYVTVDAADNTNSAPAEIVNFKGQEIFKTDFEKITTDGGSIVSPSVDGWTLGSEFNPKAGIDNSTATAGSKFGKNESSWGAKLYSPAPKTDYSSCERPSLKRFFVASPITSGVVSYQFDFKIVGNRSANAILGHSNIGSFTLYKDKITMDGRDGQSTIVTGLKNDWHTLKVFTQINTEKNEESKNYVYLNDKYIGMYLTRFPTTPARTINEIKFVGGSASSPAGGEVEAYFDNVAVEYAGSSNNTIVKDSVAGEKDINAKSPFIIEQKIMDISDLYETRVVNTIINLGIMNIDASKNFGVTSNVTREEFALAIAKFLNLNLEDNTTNKVFDDVGNTTNHEKAINILTRLKILNGVGNNLYKPKDDISTLNAIVVILRSMGYQEYSDIKGGYPYGYMDIATELKILKDIKTNLQEKLIKIDLAKLLYKSLEANVFEQISFGKNIEYSNKTGNNILKLNHSLYSVKGKVTATSIAGIFTNSSTSKGKIKIDGKLYKYETQEDILGINVIAYCKYEKNESDSNDILFIVKDENTKKHYIKTEDVMAYSDYTITYQDDNKKDIRLKLNRNASILSNYEVNTSYDLSTFRPEIDNKVLEGNIELIDADDDGLFDVVKIFSYENMVVDGIDYSDFIIYDKYSNKEIHYDENSNNIKYEIIDAQNKAIKFNEIKKGDIISIAESGVNIKLIVSKLKIDGIISEIGQEDNSEVITIGTKQYKIANNYTERGYRVGDKIVASLNFNDNIAEITTNIADQKKYGYLIKLAYSSGLNDYTQAKLLNEKGKIEIINLATKVTFLYKGNKEIKNGKVYYEGKDIYDRLMNNKSAIDRQIIMYRQDIESKINEIEFVSDSRGDYLFQFLSSPSIKYFRSASKTRSFDGEITISDKTKIFMVPDSEDNRDEDSLYGIKPLSYLISYNYKVQGYAYGENKISPDIIVIYHDIKRYSGEGRMKKESMIVEKVTWVVDENGDSVQKVTGYSLGMNVTYLGKDKNVFTNAIYQKDSPDNILNYKYEVESGDILRVTTDITGKAMQCEIIYDQSTDTLVTSSNPSSTSFADIYRITKGIINEKQDSFIKIKYGTNDFDVYNADYFDIRIYDSVKKTVTKGTISDLISESEAGLIGASKVLLYTYYAEGRDIYVYK